MEITKQDFGRLMIDKYTNMLSESNKKIFDSVIKCNPDAAQRFVAFKDLVNPKHEYDHYAIDRQIDFSESELKIIDTEVAEIEIGTIEGNKKFEILVMEQIAGIATPITQEVIARIVDIEPSMEAIRHNLKNTFSPDILRQYSKDGEVDMDGAVIIELVNLEKQKERLQIERRIFWLVASLGIIFFFVYKYLLMR
jgi:hypothetical protein